MAADIPGYDVQDAVPWNTDSGKNLAPARTPVPLAFTTDIISDPADTDSICDPAVGYDTPASRITEL